VSIDKAVLDSLPKRLLFTTLQNADFMGSADTNPYFFKHLNLIHFVVYVNGRQVNFECLSKHDQC